jgi:hypothetical protein
VIQREKMELPELLATARKYCSFVESTDNENSKFLTDVQMLLLELYLLGRQLRDVDAVETGFEDLLSDHDYKAVLKNISDRCPFQYYWTIIDPFNFNDTNQQIGTGDLLDDLGDIYHDLKRTLLLYDSGLNGARLQAMWQMKFDFDSHWGTHCVDSIKAIHDYLAQE